MTKTMPVSTKMTMSPVALCALALSIDSFVTASIWRTNASTL